jgi:hypothetical protein
MDMLSDIGQSLVGSAIGCLVGGPLSDYVVSLIAKRRAGYFKPEYRLWYVSLPHNLIE